MRALRWLHPIVAGLAMTAGFAVVGLAGRSIAPGRYHWIFPLSPYLDAAFCLLGGSCFGAEFGQRMRTVLNLLPLAEASPAALQFAATRVKRQSWSTLVLFAAFGGLGVLTLCAAPLWIERHELARSPLPVWLDGLLRALAMAAFGWSITVAAWMWWTERSIVRLAAGTG